MSHTKGGWDRNIAPATKYPVIYAGRNTHVAQVLSAGLTPEEVEANCNLIAAAPDLLAACELAFAVLGITCDAGNSFHVQALCDIQSAIDKAKGA